MNDCCNSCNSCNNSCGFLSGNGSIIWIIIAIIVIIWLFGDNTNNCC